jgi:hypothetical protein
MFSKVTSHWLTAMYDAAHPLGGFRGIQIVGVPSEVPAGAAWSGALGNVRSSVLMQQSSCIALKEWLSLPVAMPCEISGLKFGFPPLHPLLFKKIFESDNFNLNLNNTISV